MQNITGVVRFKAWQDLSPKQDWWFQYEGKVIAGRRYRTKLEYGMGRINPFRLIAAITAAVAQAKE